MKKTLLIVMLSFLIVSCNKDTTEIQETDILPISEINEVAAPEKFSTSVSEGESPSLFE